MVPVTFIVPLQQGQRSGAPPPAFAEATAGRPHFEDEVAPERAHVAGPAFGRGGDEEDLGGLRFFGWRLGWMFGFGRRDDAVGDGGALAAGFVGVDAVVADGLLALGGEVEQSGGDEVVGFEDLEVALGVMVAFGAVDDGLGGGVPSDFLLKSVDSGDGRTLSSNISKVGLHQGAEAFDG